MQPLLVIDVLDEVGNTPLNILQGAVFPQVDFLGLQCLDEALRIGIVQGVGLAAHADLEIVKLQFVHIVFRGILHAAIGVMDTAWRRIAIDNGHAQGGHRKLGIQVSGNRVADRLAGEHVQDYRQIDEAYQDMDVGQIGHPDLVNAVYPAVGNQVRITRLPVIRT